jgi:hypothetical protein
MTLRGRIVASLFSAGASLAIVMLLAHASSAASGTVSEYPGRAGARGLISAAAEPPCGGATDGTYLSTAFAVALRISAEERGGAEVTRDLNTIEADRVLANAVAAGDLATVQSEVFALIHDHQHIVRLRVLRGGQLLYDFGGPLVLAPVAGVLRVGGRVVGEFVMSVQDDLGYQKLAERLVGAHVVMRYQGQTIMSDLAVGSEPLPARGSVIVGNVPYLVASFTVGRFPDGVLDVSILLQRPASALARQSCAQVVAGTLADVAQRVYDEARVGEAFAGPPLTALARATQLSAALAAGDDSTATQIVKSMVAAGGFARLRVVAGGRVVADIGVSAPLLAPVTAPLLNAGAVVGEAVFAVETAPVYAGVAGGLVRAPVLVRAGTRQLAGTFAGPATLPANGPISYRGVHYEVASFAAVAFPNQHARIYVLGPGPRLG